MGVVIVEWASGGSERTFDQSAANSRNEPNLCVRYLCCVRSQKSRDGGVFEIDIAS